MATVVLFRPHISCAWILACDRAEDHQRAWLESAWSMEVLIDIAIWAALVAAAVLVLEIVDRVRGR